MAQRRVGATVRTANVVGIIQIRIGAGDARAARRTGGAPQPIHRHHFAAVWSDPNLAGKKFKFKMSVMSSKSAEKSCSAPSVGREF